MVAAPNPNTAPAPNTKSGDPTTNQNTQTAAAANATAPPDNQPGPNEPRDNLPLSVNLMANPMDLTALHVGSTGFTGAHYESAANKATPLFRGMIRENTKIMQHSGAPFALYFCFNPTDVTLGYDLSVGMGFWPPGWDTAEMQGLKIANSKTSSFSLVFDRTYEVYQGQKINDSIYGPGVMGVLWDARAAERLIGIYDANPMAPGVVSILDVILARANAMPGEAPVPGATGMQPLWPLNFTGWISSLSIDFTRFDMNMIPTRCAMNIEMTMTFQMPNQPSGTNPPDPSASGADGSASRTDALNRGLTVIGGAQ